MIPNRGSWLDIEYDHKDIVHARIDRRRKLPVTTFLMGLDNQETSEKRAKLDRTLDELKHIRRESMKKLRALDEG